MTHYLIWLPILASIWLGGAVMPVGGAINGEPSVSDGPGRQEIIDPQVGELRRR